MTNPTHLIFPLCFLFTGPSLLAQQSVEVTETSTEYDKQRLASLTIRLDAPVDAVYDLWEEFWDDRYDVDIDRTDKDRSAIAYLAEEVSLIDISRAPFSLYSSVDGTDKVSTVSMSVSTGENMVVTRASDPDAQRGMTEKLREFRTYFYGRYFDERIEAMREELEDARDEREDASGDAEKARRKIEKYEKKIEDLRKKIDDTRSDVGDELEAAEESERRVLELEEELRKLQTARNNYLG